MVDWFQRTTELLSMRYLRLLALLLVVGLASYEYLRYGAATKAVHEQLLQEFTSIRVPGNTSELRFSNAGKPHHVLVGATYQTTLPYSSVAKHYDAELGAKGWYLASERQSDHSNVTTSLWCKGPLAASLEYAGEPAAHWAYSLTLTWGLHYCPGDH